MQNKKGKEFESEMNIKEAKEEITHTFQAYMRKDEFGAYRMAPVRQRPILLMGPPGIGKTAVVEQAARECQAGFVSYTITHHTRQSAVGLPFIEKREYGGLAYSVTEYTMSEIIAAVYEKMEASGLKEGILFLDEINCVSETLAPAMLQFLQGKTFGNHKLPEGWLIVAAGNPPEYNKSVREFDIVTLDRVKRIPIEADYSVWKEYAYRYHIHEGILSYLDVRKEYFYAVETTIDGKQFVTARGWEDLSNVLYAYEELNIPVTREIVEEYLQHTKIAADFANYLELYNKYEKEYHVEDIIEGKCRDTIYDRLKEAPFDERLSVVSLLMGRLSEEFVWYTQKTNYVERLFDALKRYKALLGTGDSAGELLEGVYRQKEIELERSRYGGLLEPDEERLEKQVLETLRSYGSRLKEKGIYGGAEGFELMRQLFGEETQKREDAIEKTAVYLKNSFIFMEKAFGLGQEMVLFVTLLTSNYYSMQYISENGCEDYYRYNRKLMFRETRKELLEEIDRMEKFQL